MVLQLQAALDKLPLLARSVVRYYCEDTEPVATLDGGLAALRDAQIHRRTALLVVLDSRYGAPRAPGRSWLQGSKPVLRVYLLRVDEVAELIIQDASIVHGVGPGCLDAMMLLRNRMRQAWSAGLRFMRGHSTRHSSMAHVLAGHFSAFRDAADNVEAEKYAILRWLIAWVRSQHELDGLAWRRLPTPEMDVEDWAARPAPGRDMAEVARHFEAAIERARVKVSHALGC